MMMDDSIDIIGSTRLKMNSLHVLCKVLYTSKKHGTKVPTLDHL